ncbi:MAG: hypothetical protein RL299_1882 [Pseudomonadota bacterium]|jgi:hypothetical protein
MDHLEAIERLHRLKESGALSEEEFAAQKAQLLAAAAAPAAAEPDWAPAPAPGLNKGLLGGIAAAVVILGAGAWYGLSGSGAPSSQPSAAASDAGTAVTTTTVPAIASLPEGEQLRLASIAALGFTGSRTRKDGTQSVITKAERLVQLPFGVALLTSTHRPDDCHACSGYVGVYYLMDEGGQFKVTGKWPEAVSGWGWGNVPEWRLSGDYTVNPAVVASGSDGNQGYFCGGTSITELTAKGPVTSFIATSATNEGAVDPDSGTDMGGNPLMNLEGKIVGVQKGKSLQVKITGTDSFTESYVMKGGKFVLTSGETKLGC